MKNKDAYPPKISIVIPIYNEAEALRTVVAALQDVLDEVDISYELLCVDDGSTDDSLEKLIAAQTECNELQIIELSRNFGKEAALSAGLDHARGDAVIPFDADMQDPPDLIPKMIEQWKAGFDVVLARRRNRSSDTWLKRATAWAFYRTHNVLADVTIPADVGDFRLMDRKVVEAVRSMPEQRRFMKGIFAWVGFRTTILDYERRERHAGKSSWPFWQLWNLALEGITSFSMLPLRLWSYVGLFIAVLSFIYGSAIVIRTFVYGVDVPGYASVFSAVLFLGGLQLLCLGLLGEYVGRIYGEVKRRPVYVVRRQYDPESLKPPPSPLE